MEEKSKEVIALTGVERVISTTDDIIALAECRLENIQKLISLSLRRTNENDWVDQNGKPYLTGSGAEKIARLFGVKIHSVKVEKKASSDDRGGFYFYQVSGIAELPGKLDSMEAIGTCSSRDQFFAKAKGEWRPMHEVDETNIMKSAYTNFIGNAITRLLGIRNLTWADIKTAGIDVDKIAKVQYKGGSKDQPGGQGEQQPGPSPQDQLISEPQRARFWAKCNTSKIPSKVIDEHLKSMYGITRMVEIKRTFYDDLCYWADNWKSGGAK